MKYVLFSQHWDIYPVDFILFNHPPGIQDGLQPVISLL